MFQIQHFKYQQLPLIQDQLSSQMPQNTKYFFIYTTGYLHNIKAKSKLKYTTDPYLIFGDQTGEMGKFF